MNRWEDDDTADSESISPEHMLLMIVGLALFMALYLYLPMP